MKFEIRAEDSLLADNDAKLATSFKQQAAK
jgi:hypothetical protein